MSTNHPSRRVSKAALACLEEAFLLCIPEPGDTIQVVSTAKIMGLEEELGPHYGQACAHALVDRLVQSGYVVKIPSTHPIRVERLHV